MPLKFRWPEYEREKVKPDVSKDYVNLTLIGSVSVS